MNFLVDQLMQFTDTREAEQYSCLRKSIATLNRRIDWVPKGWLPIYQDLLKSLLNLNDDVHGNSKVVGPWIEDSRMEFSSRNLTPVVAGILRKTMQRSQCTCKNCGQPGKVRSIGEESHEVLCARCYAPKELAVQLDKWIPRLESSDFLESESVVVVDDLDLAFLALIPQTKWRWLPSGSDGDSLPYLLSRDLVGMLPELRNLQALVMAMGGLED